jgi:hypothetical protein
MTIEKGVGEALLTGYVRLSRRERIEGRKVIP